VIQYLRDLQRNEYLRVDTCTPRSHRYDAHLKNCRVVFRGKGGTWDVHHGMAGDSYLATLMEFNPQDVDKEIRFWLGLSK